MPRVGEVTARQASHMADLKPVARTNYNRFIAVDPGKSGGLVCLGATGAVLDMKAIGGMTLHDLWGWFVLYSATCAPDYDDNPIAVIEKVGGFIGAEAGESGTEAGSDQKGRGHTMFAFGAIAGQLEMGLVAAGIPFEKVTPQKWVKCLNIPPRKKTETKTQWKNRLKGIAQQMFPSVAHRITLAVSDALLMAEYLRRMST